MEFYEMANQFLFAYPYHQIENWYILLLRGALASLLAPRGPHLTHLILLWPKKEGTPDMERGEGT